MTIKGRLKAARFPLDEVNEHSMEKGIVSETNLSGGGQVYCPEDDGLAETQVIEGLRKAAETFKRLGTVSDFGWILQKEVDGRIEAPDGIHESCLS